MEHAVVVPTGSVDEAQTLPASVPAPLGLSYLPQRQLERQLAHQTALARFGRMALRATEAEALVVEAAALLHWAFPRAEGGAFDLVAEADKDELAFAEALADMLEAAQSRLLAEQESRHAALHDPLTGLANRSLILDHLQLALARSGRRPACTAVLFLDLDGFKHINDTLGHLAGDDLLVSVAERLRGAVRPADTLGRWGGDEFVLVCEEVARADDALAIARRLASALALPFAVRGSEVRIAASVGVAVSMSDEDQPAMLIHAADLAMYRAKPDPVPGGPEAPSARFPVAVPHPRLELLTGRLHDLLSGLGPQDRTSSG